MLIAACDDDAPQGRPRTAIDAGALVDAGFAPFAAIEPQFPRAGMPLAFGDLAFGDLEPGGGPPAGGQLVRVPGQGFSRSTLLEVDGVRASPAADKPVSARELWVVMPPHAPGTVEIAVQDGDVRVARARAYEYWPFDVQPRLGPVTGGTRLTLALDEDSASSAREVQLAGLSCTEFERDGSTLSCTTPAAEIPGLVDVVVTAGDGTMLRARGAFEYTSQNLNPGVHGDPLLGQLELTVFDERTGKPYPDLWLLVEGRTGRNWTGRTDRRGQLTLSDPDLIAPVDVHVFGPCIDYHSVLGAGKSVVVVSVSPLYEPEQAECRSSSGSSLAVQPTERESPDGSVSGQVVLPGGWDALPKPRPGERRMVHVDATRVSIQNWNSSPFDPTMTEEYSFDITESEAPDAERLDFWFRTRPTVLAVYAVAGIENEVDRTFVPHAMGIVRRVTVAPQQQRDDLEIPIDIPLDGVLEVDVEMLPQTSVPTGAYLSVAAVLDFGAEGVLNRTIGENYLDHETKVESTQQVFSWRPELVDELRDARLRVQAHWRRSRLNVLDVEVEPLFDANVEVEQLFDADSTSVAFTALLGLVQLTMPMAETWAAERTLEWTVGEDARAADPDVQMLAILDAVRRWDIIAPGSMRKVALPDPTELDESLADPLAAPLGVGVEALRGFSPQTYVGREPNRALVGQRWASYIEFASPDAGVPDAGAP